MLHKDHKVDAINGIVYGVKGKPLKFQKQNKNGYWRTRVKFASGKRGCEYLHRIICFYMNGPNPPGKTEVCHKDGNQDNNRGDNLEWGDRADQIADTKLHAKPRKTPVRLSTKEKRAVRKSDLTNTEIAMEYNIHQRTVQHIRNS